MIIGIDIDGVLCPYDDFVNHYGSKLSNEVGKFPLKNPFKYDFHDKFECDSEFAELFTEKYEKLRLEQSAIPFSSEVISKLKNEGHTIYIITARCNYDSWLPEKMKPFGEEFTINWLKQNNILYDKIFFGLSKKIVCSENNVDVLIEDSPENIEAVSEVTNVLIFSTNYNNLPKFKGIARAYTWYDVYNKINELSKKK